MTSQKDQFLSNIDKIIAKSKHESIGLDKHPKMKQELYAIGEKFAMMKDDLLLLYLNYEDALDVFSKTCESPNYTEELISKDGKFLIKQTDIVIQKNNQVLEKAFDAINKLIEIFEMQIQREKTGEILDIALREEDLNFSSEDIKRRKDIHNKLDELAKETEEKPFDFMTPKKEPEQEVSFTINTMEVNL